MNKYLISYGVRTFKVMAESNAEARRKAVAMWAVPAHLRGKISAVKIDPVTPPFAE